MKSLSETKTNKRPEENYKYIYKKCLKILKQRFLETHNVRNLKKEESERLFYSHYFGTIANEEKIKLECFYQPRGGKSAKGQPASNKRNMKPSKVSKDDICKTISCVYIKTVGKSEKFVKDISQLLNTTLLENYIRNIDKKIQNIFQDWRNLGITEPLTHAHVSEICERIEKNEKFKMPWTIHEFKTAIEALQQLFRKNVEGF